MSTNKYNATCAICGKPYHMCYSCKKNDKSLVWKRFCDTPEHYKIYQLVHGYTTGLYTKAEAKRKLKNIDTSDLDELRPNIRDILVGIMGDDGVDKKVEIPESEPIETVESPVETVESEPAKSEPSTKARRTHKRTVAKVASDDAKVDSEPVEA